MAELAVAIPFAFLAALLVYVVLQVPLTARDEVIDLRDHGGAALFAARLLFVTRVAGGVTVDGATLATGEPFSLEVGRPEGWSLEDVAARLETWARDDALVDVLLHEDLRGQRAWISSGEDAIDLPVRAALGVQSAR